MRRWVKLLLFCASLSCLHSFLASVRPKPLNKCEAKHLRETTAGWNEICAAQSRVIQKAIVSALVATSTSTIPIGFQNAHAVTQADWMCSDNVVVLDGTGKDVTVVGTAHISEDSVDQVRYAIRGTKPDVVMIELDKRRLGTVDNSKGTLADFGFIEPQSVARPSPAKSTQPLQALTEASMPLPQLQPVGSSFEKVNALQQISEYVVNTFNTFTTATQKLLGAVLGKTLSQFYSSVEKLGFNAGGEFKAAVQEARKLGAPVLLGDRDVDVTLRRLASALTSVDAKRATSLVTRLSDAEKELGLSLTPDQDISKLDKDMLSKFVEDLKQRSSITKITNIIQQEIPAVYDALIGERDAYMADAVRTAPGHNIVGVVGLAHLSGIQKSLELTGMHSVPQQQCRAILP